MPESTRQRAVWECRGCPLCEALELARVRYYDGSKAAGLPILKPHES